MLAVFSAVNHPNYRYLCDIGNFGGVDEDCAVAVSKLLPLISHVHAKDSLSGPACGRIPAGAGIFPVLATIGGPPFSVREISRLINA